MTESMHVDQNANAVPVMRPTGGSEYSFDVGAASARTPVAVGQKVVGLYASAAMYIKFGGSDVVAASDDYDVWLPEGAYREYEMERDTHIAAIQDAGAGKLHVNGFK